MIIVTASLNKTKVKACEAIFPEFEVFSKRVNSEVASQPMSDEETRQGAINRANNAVPDKGIGIGLEGGVMFMGQEIYLCNWGALATSDGNLFTASGARIRLPEFFIKPLRAGEELGTLMENYSKREQVRSKEGAVGIFTNERINRSEMFTHVVALLRGQWEYALK